MHISIAQRLKPFSHLPGMTTILPGWGCLVQIFPCLIRLYRLEGGSPLLLSEIALDLKGPVEQFTVCNDLEKGCLTVSGKTEEGWIRYHLLSARKNDGVRFISEKTPTQGFVVHTSKNRYILHEKAATFIISSQDSTELGKTRSKRSGLHEEGMAKAMSDEEDRSGEAAAGRIPDEMMKVAEKEWLDLLDDGVPFEPYQIPPRDRLSLGSHKKQDFEMIKRRLDLVEIFPLLHRLGQLIPRQTWEGSNMKGGAAALLEDCRQCARGNKPEKGAVVWKRFFLAAFQGMLVPQEQDTHFQGLIPVTADPIPSFFPLSILSESALLIREIFFRQNGEQLSILPFLFPEFHAGRLLDIPLAGGGSLSLEWTKKTIRRLILDAGRDEELFFHFPRDVHSYRLRQGKTSGKGERRNCGTGVLVQKNIRYYFDNFQ